jgi:crotonobetainyl-CoA:carnitine CoA-transferase CaiB-like acyl-CoA transferase
MTAVMSGVRVVEVGEHIFVPAAAALLRDWGAEVVKVEPVERGDAVRGLTGSGASRVQGMHQHANRGKRSLALDLSAPRGLEILYALCQSADVFMTNKVRRVRRKLKIELDDIRAHNPRIIYVRGTGQGELGPESDRGSYDLLNFWHRSGASMGTLHADGSPPFLPGPGFGDSIGAMTIAGGIMGALYHRERTGEAPVVDVSLLSTGMWAMGAGIAMAAVSEDWQWPPTIPNPLSRAYRTKDDRWIALCCLQPARYWAELCDHLAMPELAVDARFTDHASLMANSAAAVQALTDAFQSRPMVEWQANLVDFSGQWTAVQSAHDAAEDEQAAANGYLQQCSTESGSPFTLVAPPVQYDMHPASTTRAPEFNEQGDEILAEIGLDWEEIVELKVQGIVG